MSQISTFIDGLGGVAWMVGSFVVALSIIVAVHEYGHYIVGRWCGIKADVFSIGFGPVLASKIDRHGTRWQIAAFPLGGYVKFKGDMNAASVPQGDTSETQSAAELRGTMHGAPLWARALTVAAGPVFNFIFAALLFAALFWWQGQAKDILVVAELYPTPYAIDIQEGDEIVEVAGISVENFSEFGSAIEQVAPAPLVPYRVMRGEETIDVVGPFPTPVRVGSVEVQTAAIRAGIQIGDIITSVNETPIYSFNELAGIVGETQGAELRLDIWRNGENLQIAVTPNFSDISNREGQFEKRWFLGIESSLFFKPEFSSTDVWIAFSVGIDQVGFIITMSLKAFGQLLTGGISVCNLSGPISIAETSGQAAAQDLVSFIGFIAVISTAIGLMNLFPIPVLDGGHLLFHAYEAVMRRPPSEKAMQVLMALGISMILTLMIVATMTDLFC